MYQLDRFRHSALEIAYMQRYAREKHGLSMKVRYGQQTKNIDCFVEDMVAIYNLVSGLGHEAFIATSNPEVGNNLSVCGIPWVNMNAGQDKLPPSNQLCEMFDGAWFCSQHDTAITGPENPDFQCAERMAEQVQKWIDRRRNQDTCF
ncbi:hypothetical protein HDE_08672 [Halotydeus destructor]|nr:hypothetical protein HDE_08672 [Halotydeus destructor]